jgi:hypothetical protein
MTDPVMYTLDRGGACAAAFQGRMLGEPGNGGSESGVNFGEIRKGWFLALTRQLTS